MPTGATDLTHPTTNCIKVAIIGAGITGLSAAHRLIKQARSLSIDINVSLFEATARAGGVIETKAFDSSILEGGPDSFITQKPAAIDLCRELGINDRLIPTSKQHRRAFVAFRNRLHVVPEGFILLAPTYLWPVLKSTLLSPFGKLRMTLDLVLPKADNQLDDESVASFVSRRFGKETLDRLAQPLYSGIYAADPRELSLRATMPRFIELEERHRSIILGLRHEQFSSKTINEQESGARYGMFLSLDHGMSLLVDKLLDSLPPNTLNTLTPLSKLSRSHTKWGLTFANGTTESFDYCILATPAWESARLLSELSPPLAHELASITYASSIVINFVFDRDNINHPLDGFGFVVPEIERKSITACSFLSIKFPNRAHGNRIILRAFLGNALHPEICDLDDEALQSAALSDLTHYLAIIGKPQITWLKRWPNSMPQYRVGHLGLISRIRSRLGSLEGLILAGAAFGGVGIPDCIISGETAAHTIIDQVREKYLSRT